MIKSEKKKAEKREKAKEDAKTKEKDGNIAYREWIKYKENDANIRV